MKDESNNLEQQIAVLQFMKAIGMKFEYPQIKFD